MTAQEIIDYARDTMLGFGIGFLPDDTELLRRLSEEIRKLIEELVLIENMALALPGDANGNVNVAVYAASYALPATLWRIRQTTLNYSSGPARAIRRVYSSWRNRVPQFQPSMYIVGSDFFPIDGGSTRSQGWALAASVDFDFVTAPTELAAAADTVESPDEAKAYLGSFLAWYMAVRGKVAQQTLAEIKGQRDGEKQRLFALAGAHPGAQAT